jgi:hypothetical protein
MEAIVQLHALFALHPEELPLPTGEEVRWNLERSGRYQETKNLLLRQEIRFKFFRLSNL